MDAYMHFVKPPTVRTVGGTESGWEQQGIDKTRGGLVGGMDRKGWVVGVDDEEEDDAIGKELPDWDSFITVGNGNKATDSFSASSSSFGQSRKPARFQAQTRAHSSGSIDIIVQEEVDSIRDKPKTSVAFGRGTQIKAKKTLTAFFDEQQQKVDQMGQRLDRKNRPKPRPLETKEGERAPVDNVPKKEEDKTELPCRERENVDSPEKENTAQATSPGPVIEAKPVEKKSFVFEDELSFWNRKQRQVLGSPVSEGIPRQDNFGDGLKFLEEEVEIFAQSFFRLPQTAPVDSLSVEHLHEILQSDKSSTGTTNPKGETVLRLRSLPTMMQKSKPLYDLWCCLERTLGEFARRDRHQKDVNRENIVSIHRSIKKLRETQATKWASENKHTQARVEKIVAKLNSDHQELVIEKDRRIHELELELCALKDNCQRLESEAHIKKRVTQLLAQEKEKLKQETERRNQQQRDEKQRHARHYKSQMDALSMEKLQLDEEKARLARVYTKQIDELQTELYTQRDRLACQHDQEIAALKQTHDKVVKKIEKKMNQLMQDHEDFVKELRNEESNKITALRREHNMQLEMARRATKIMDTKMAEMKKNYQSETDALKKQHTRQTEAYTKDLRRLKARKTRPKNTGLMTEVTNINMELERSESPPPPPPPLSKSTEQQPPPPPPPPPRVAAASEVYFTQLLDEYINT